jgi:malonate decarboxylase beta subunit
VRLHEANAGLIAVSELLRAVLRARLDGVKFIGLIGGAGGCFGGTGLIARCCDVLVMSEEGRLGMSGPEVIETARGVEEFDSRDRALVWRVTGGKHRYLLGEVDRLVEDDVGCFRAAAIDALATDAGLSLAAVEREHAQLRRRWERFGGCDDAPEIWQMLGVREPERVSLLTVEQFVVMANPLRSAS